MTHLFRTHRWTPLTALLTLLLLVPLMLPTQTAHACWNSVVAECFDRPFTSFPWQNPIGSGRSWDRQSNQSTSFWGIQSVVYNSTWSDLCGNDTQSLWCMGGAGIYDPDFNTYTPNLLTYATYGPFSLAEAESAVMTFQLLCETENGGDSVFWGVADNPILANADVLLIDGAFSGSTFGEEGQNWLVKAADLSDLHDIDGNPGSAIGLPQLWAFWVFQSNSNTVSTNPLDNGAFIDNVLIQWDDGGLDMSMGGVRIVHPDSSLIGGQDVLVIGDSIRVDFNWSTCTGGIEEYPPIRIQVIVEDPLSFETVVMDSVFENIPQDTIMNVISPIFQFERDGQHVARVIIDPEDEVDETRENNNMNGATIESWPPNPHPEFTWITPGENTGIVAGDESVMLRWEVYDVAEDATYSIFVDNNDSGCGGQVLPGGANLVEQDGPDSLEWDLTSLFPGTERWVFVLLYDSQFDTCIYAPFQVQRVVDAAGEPTGVATEFHLAQNYPNPFNPRTEISYGITQGGHVSLKVHDVLGRHVGTLVNESLVPGTYTTSFEAGSLPSGVYLYTLSAPEGVQHRKMILMK